MKSLDRYIASAILKYGLSTLFICTLLVVAVQLFMDMNLIVNSNTALIEVIKMALLGVPEYMMMVSSISFLFATTFLLSQLYANNEMIVFYNSGISYRRLIRPILILAILLSILFAYLFENFFIDLMIKHDSKREELFGRSSTFDNRNVNIQDTEENYILHASAFIEATSSLTNVTIVDQEDGRIVSRLEAKRGRFDEEKRLWVFTDVNLFSFDDLDKVSVQRLESYSDERYHLEPRLFRNLSGTIKTMPLEDARNYLRRMKLLDIRAYRENIVDLYDRLFSPYQVLILMLISCSMSYRFKKNVFLFSIIQSLCAAVVYYVAQMVLAITTKQGFTSEYVYLLGPVLLSALLVSIMKLIGTRNA